jgi:hypothetical protein
MYSALGVLLKVISIDLMSHTLIVPDRRVVPIVLMYGLWLGEFSNRAGNKCIVTH